MTLDESTQLARSHKGLLVEEDQELKPLFPMPGVGFCIEQGKGYDLPFHIVDSTDKKPISAVTIFVHGAQATYRALTNKDGKAVVRVFEETPGPVIISPSANYWSQVIPFPTASGITTVPLERLELNGAAVRNRKLMGLEPEFPFTAQGIKIAVLDSGIAQHADLEVAGGINTIDGEDPQDFRRDDHGHGTHCAGIIAGRNGDSGVLGMVPDAGIYSVKVFPGGHLSDLLEGLQWSLDNKMDVVNLSLSIGKVSQILAGKLAELASAGITIVAAAGNESNHISYPAANDGVLAVTAFGSTESFPENSAHSLRVSDLYNPQSGLFFANFSNVGIEADFTAPGVAVISTVPGGYAAWDGTSMACPFICGLAALVLSAHPELKTGDVSQPLAVHHMLSHGSIDLGLPSELQGAGVPQANRVLASALARNKAVQRLSFTRQQQLDRVQPLIADLKQKQEEIRELLAQVG